jgi:hypothetical protein
MSYQYNTSRDAPPTIVPHQPHYTPTSRYRLEEQVQRPSHQFEQLTPTSAYNISLLLPPQPLPPRRGSPLLELSAPSPHRKNRSTKVRRYTNQPKRKNGSTVTNAMKNEVKMLLECCRASDWQCVLRTIQANPLIALEPMTMDNNISTTTLHQAITSKGDTAIRAEVISTILSATPEAAALKNGYGSLPLHVIAQRNVKMDAQTKERFMIELVHCYRDALTHNGGVGGRTPLHIIFTGTSPNVELMLLVFKPFALTLYQYFMLHFLP